MLWSVYSLCALCFGSECSPCMLWLETATLFFFLVLSTVQRSRVSWALSVRKATPWLNWLLQKIGNMLYWFAFMLEASVQRFLSVWLSIWGQWGGYEKSSMSRMVIMRVWQLRSLTLIVLIRKELPNLLLRAWLWLTMIPVSQSGSELEKSQCLSFLSGIQHFS